MFKMYLICVLAFILLAQRNHSNYFFHDQQPCTAVGVVSFESKQLLHNIVLMDLIWWGSTVCKRSIRNQCWFLDSPSSFSISLRIAFFLIAQVICESAITTDFSADQKADGPEKLNMSLEPIVGTKDFRANVTIDLSGKPWYDDRKERYRCVRPAKCEKLQNSTCFGSKIQFKYTSVQLSNEESQENSLKKLYQLEAFRNIPECWAVIQVHKITWDHAVDPFNKQYFYYSRSHFCVPFTCQNV